MAIIFSIFLFNPVGYSWSRDLSFDLVLRVAMLLLILLAFQSTECASGSVFFNSPGNCLHVIYVSLFHFIVVFSFLIALFISHACGSSSRAMPVVSEGAVAGLSIPALVLGLSNV